MRQKLSAYKEQGFSYTTITRMEADLHWAQGKLTKNKFLWTLSNYPILQARGKYWACECACTHTYTFFKKHIHIYFL